MNGEIIKRSESSLDTRSIDAIVGSYAAIGAAELRRRRKWSWVLSACAVVLVSCAIVGQPKWLFPFLRSADFEEFRASVETRLDGSLDELEGGLGELEGGLGRLEGERAALEQQRSQINAQLSLLTEQLAYFETQTNRWEQQRLQLERQSDAVVAAMQGLAAEREALRADIENRLLTEQQALAEQAALDSRMNEFVVEESTIDTDLEKLYEQRRNAELQREALEREMAELEAQLFEENNDNISARGAPGSEAAPDSDVAIEPSATPDMENTRAGIRFGGGMNVSLGMTRSGSINGVDQFNDSVDLGNITSGIDWSTMEIGLGGIVLQNGTRNTISAGALDAVSSGFGSILQNNLDDQLISTETIYDVRIEDVSRAINGISAGQALEDTLRFQQ